MSSTSSFATSSYSDLFPTSSGNSSADDGSKAKTSTNVYYLVFLGVLVILMLIALCLTVRAMRMRRRYRTATQIALSRGEPIPDTMREDFWGFGGLTGWTSDGWDRFGAVRPGDETRRDKKPKWERVPVLKEAEVEKEKVETENVWDSIQPLTLHSLRSRNDTSAAPDFAGPGTRPSFPGPNSQRSRSQNAMFNFRNYPPPPTSSAIPQGRSRSRQRPANDAELNRPLEPGEPIRLAVVIQMPNPSDGRQRYKTDEMTEEEEVAWEGGMELGVWEGAVMGGGNGKSFQRENTMQTEEDGESEMEGAGVGLARSRSQESFANGDIGLYR
ncbi:hypothetical protein IAT38_008283 [Cryptococcus sp. DSM 104549]